MRFMTTSAKSFQSIMTGDVLILVRGRRGCSKVKLFTQIPLVPTECPASLGRPILVAEPGKAPVSALLCKLPGKNNLGVGMTLEDIRPFADFKEGTRFTFL